MLKIGYITLDFQGSSVAIALRYYVGVFPEDMEDVDEVLRKICQFGSINEVVRLF